MKADLYKEVTDAIIEAMENGQFSAISWARDGMPSNYASKKKYHGINTLILSIIASRNPGFTSQWLTYKQAVDVGGQVRKGEKGSRVVFFKPWEVTDKNNPNGEKKTIPVLRHFTVFNSAQIDGLPVVVRVEPACQDVIERLCTASAQSHLDRSGAKIDIGGDVACYRPSLDTISMPPLDRFKRVQDWYAVAMHELTHWTGHKSRLDRNMDKYPVEQRYAREELVAELGAAFVCGSLGFEGLYESHASYLDSWLSILKSDSRAIFRAAAQAQKAADFILKEKTEEAFTEETIAA